MLRDKQQSRQHDELMQRTRLGKKPTFRRLPIPRSGFSLMEVMVAMAICVLGLAMVLQITSLSQSFSQKAMDATDLQIIAQNRINEVLSSIRPAEDVAEEVCPENDQVFYKLSVREHPKLPLAVIEVTVWFKSEPANRKLAQSKGVQSSRNQTLQRERSREFHLSRWIHTGQSSVLAESNTVEVDGVTQ